MRKIFLPFVVFAFLLLNLNAPTVLGCAFHPGDSWYAVDVKVVDNPLSNVLGISFSDNGELITLTNLGLASTLYIGSKDVDGKYPGYDRTRQDYKPLEEIFGKEFEPNVRMSVENGLLKGVGVFHGGWGRGMVLNDRSTQDSGTVVLQGVLDSTDNYKTKQKIGDNRPDDAPIPEPDYQTMYAFYEGSRYEIPIVLTYSLKENYVPNMMSSSCDGEEEALSRVTKKHREETLKRLIIYAGTIVGLLAIAIVTYKAVKKDKKRTTATRKSAKKTTKPKSRPVRKK